MNINKTIASLKHNGYSVSFYSSSNEAAAYIDSQINGKIVGFGDSQSMIKMKLYDLLSKHNVVYDPNQSKNDEEFVEIAKKCLTTDVFLTSVNALSETGEMVNIDGTGNRVAGSLFGHEKVFFVIGTNKIEESLEKAIWRARNIAGPLNAKKYNLPTPCVAYGDKTGEYNKCFDCNIPGRICNSLVIHLKKMNDVKDMEIVLIDESLGY